VKSESGNLPPGLHRPAIAETTLDEYETLLKKEAGAPSEVPSSAAVVSRNLKLASRQRVRGQKVSLTRNVHLRSRQEVIHTWTSLMATHQFWCTPCEGTLIPRRRK